MANFVDVLMQLKLHMIPLMFKMLLMLMWQCLIHGQFRYSSADEVGAGNFVEC